MKKKSGKKFSFTKNHFIYVLILAIVLLTVAYAYDNVPILNNGKIDPNTMQYHELREIIINDEGLAADRDEDGILDQSEDVKWSDTNIRSCLLMADGNGNTVCGTPWGDPVTGDYCGDGLITGSETCDTKGANICGAGEYCDMDFCLCRSSCGDGMLLVAGVDRIPGNADDEECEYPGSTNNFYCTDPLKPNCDSNCLCSV